MTWLTPTARQTEIKAAHITQFTDWLQALRNEAASIIYNASDAPTLKIRNSHASGVALQIRNAANSADLMSVGPSAVTFTDLDVTTADIGTGSYETGAEAPDSNITTPVGGSIKVGTHATPYSDNAPAFTISAISAGNVEDGVGTGLSMHVVRAGNGGADKPTDGLNIWVRQTAAGNISGVYPRVVPKEPQKFTSEATFNVTVALGAVTAITVNSGGSGYTVAPTLIFHGNLGAGGAHATATCTISGGVVNSVTLTSGGSGYTGTPTVRALPFAGSGFAYVGSSQRYSQYMESIGVELNPDNQTGAAASPDYAIGGYYNARNGRSIGANLICYGTNTHTVGMYIGRGQTATWYAGVDIEQGALASSNPHPANIGNMAVRLPNQGWLCAKSWLTTAGADTISEPILPLTIPVLRVNSADNTLLNAKGGAILAFSSGNDPASLTTTGGFSGSTVFWVGPQASNHADNSINVDVTNKRLGVGGVVPSHPFEVANGGTTRFAVDTAGLMRITQTTAGSATGGAIAVPANAVEFLKIYINGTERRMPIFAV